MYIIVKRVYSHAKKKNMCSCINERIFISDESLFTHEEKVYAHV
jgi:hypothetical protein